MIPELVHDNFRDSFEQINKSMVENMEQVAKSMATNWTPAPEDVGAWQSGMLSLGGGEEEIGRPLSPQEKRKAHVERIRANHKKVRR